MVVSPPHTPPQASCKYRPLPPEFQLEALPATLPTVTQMDSVFPSWMHRFDDAVILTFHQTPGVTTLRTSPHLECTNMVNVTKVYADSATWRPLSCDHCLNQGHLFLLAHGGHHTCKIEMTEPSKGVFKIVVVQPEYSPVSVAANTAPESSLLEFGDIHERVKSVRALKHTLEQNVDMGYVPTRELVVTRGFGNIVLTTDHSNASFEARRQWKRAQGMLSQLSSATADCVDSYNKSELLRVGHSVGGLGEWRSLV